MQTSDAVREVLARYVRAADRRDGEAMSALFTPEGTVEMNWHNSGNPVPLGRLEGRDQIAWAVREMMEPHPERGWSHHTTSDHIVAIIGDRATIDAQFVVYKTLGAARPADGWPKDARGAQGSITPIEAGYYSSTLVKVGDQWLIERHQIDLDLPVATGDA